jgi:hypothetical protein
MFDADNASPGGNESITLADLEVHHYAVHLEIAGLIVNGGQNVRIMPGTVTYLDAVCALPIVFPDQRTGLFD